LLGQLDFTGAEGAYREALKRRPGYYDAHSDLAQLIWMRTEDAAAATAPLDAAIAANPNDLTLLVAKAKALGFAGLHEAAYDSALSALQRAPGELRLLLAVAHHAAAAGDTTAAAALGQRAYQLAPDSRGALEAWWAACLAAGRADLAFQATGRALQARPLDQLVLAFHAIAARVLGRPEYGQLYDYGAFVRPYRIEPPEGWSDLPSYLADLKAALERLHAFRGHPFDQSLRHGSQTMQNLLLSDEPAVRAFFSAVDKPIRAYMEAVGQGSDPLRARNTFDYAVRGAWSVRLRPNGFHVDHVHPQGWLSSAFYVETPAEALGSETRQGWIKFGQPQNPVKPPLAPAKYVRPEPGLLVLFPSYMFHGTVPFTTAESRMTIAFDVVPR
jgi:tetratricopeptide (TPR) repeat protein